MAMLKLNVGGTWKNIISQVTTTCNCSSGCSGTCTYCKGTCSGSCGSGCTGSCYSCSSNCSSSSMNAYDPNCRDCGWNCAGMCQTGGQAGSSTGSVTTRTKNLKQKVSGSWKSLNTLKLKVGSTWKSIS